MKAAGMGAELSSMVRVFEQRSGLTLLPGTNPAVDFYRHTSEPLPHFWRPLIIYMAFEFMAWMVGNA